MIGFAIEIADGYIDFSPVSPKRQRGAIEISVYLRNTFHNFMSISHRCRFIDNLQPKLDFLFN